MARWGRKPLSSSLPETMLTISVSSETAGIR